MVQWKRLSALPAIGIEPGRSGFPAGGPAAAACHLARAICRRAERHLVALTREETLSPAARSYLNRLSDLLFVLSRVLAREEGGSEVMWRHDRQRRKLPG